MAGQVGVELNVNCIGQDGVLVSVEGDLAERRALCYAHLKRAFQALVDRGGDAEAKGRWGLVEIERLFALWHCFRAREFGRAELRRQLIPLRARVGRLLRRGLDNPDRRAAVLCRELTKWWPALWTFARVEGVEPTNKVSERTLRPLVLWRRGSLARTAMPAVALLSGC